MRWFRFYDDAINDPKILKLPLDSRWHWTALLCIASKNNGRLPATDDIALMLRVTNAKAAAIIAELVAAGLIDRDSNGFAPHNWDGRQYKSDSSAERVKRHRDKQRNVTVTVQNRTEADTETEQNDKIVEGASRFTPGSRSLADAFLKALGFDTPLKVPPEYAGVDWRAVTWEAAGWTPDLVEADVRRVGPGKPISYYEKVFTTSFANRQAPLPVAVIKKQEKVHVAQNARGGISSALDRLIERAESNAAGSFESCEATPRLLSNG
jgi:hypothetical protein